MKCREGANPWRQWGRTESGGAGLWEEQGLILHGTGMKVLCGHPAGRREAGEGVSVDGFLFSSRESAVPSWAEMGVEGG